MKKYLLLLIGLALISGCTEKGLQPDSSINIYVNLSGSDDNGGTKSAPFKTVSTAIEYAQKISAKNISILIEPGSYNISETLKITNFSSDRHLTIKPFEQGTVEITGGREISNWTKLEGNIWVTHIEDILQGKWYFRDLYVNGERAIRARYPNPGEELMSFVEIKQIDPLMNYQDYVVDANFYDGTLAGLDCEMVSILNWSMSRQRVVKSSDKTITTYNPAGWVGMWMCFPQVRNKVYLEHAMAFMDIENEWYLHRDTGKLYYISPEGKNPNEMTFIAPVIEKLLIIKGQKDKPVSNISFENICFEYAGWQLPLAGYNGLQACTYGTKYIQEPTYMLPAAIHLEYVDNIIFNMCDIKHMGASGIALGAGSDNCSLIGCEINDIGGNGIVVGWREKADDPPRRFFENDWKDKNDAPENNTIAHCKIHKCGQVQFGAVGYFELFSKNSNVSHNLVCDLPYSGISIGFCWDSKSRTQANCTIEYNEIYNCMQKLHDGGGIYVLGYQPQTAVRNNFIHDTKSHGIYSDHFSGHILYENNIIHNAEVHGFQQNGGRYNIIRNNIISSSGMYALRRNLPTENGPAFIFERNIVYVDRYEKSDFAWYNDEQTGDKSGILLENFPSENFEMDHNLYWDTRNENISISDRSFSEHQQEREKDLHSIVADPLFENIQNHNFKLKENSPAFKIGFKPIDISNVGPAEKYKKRFEN